MTRPRGSSKGGRKRKPETLPSEEHLDMAENHLILAGRHIDTAGELGGSDTTDMLACFASNVLQGSLSLIRELRAALKTRGDHR